MKKKHALLSIVGAAVISSCAYYGQEINDDTRIVELEDAIKDLGADYDEMDIRLVRVKFLSEVAN